MTNEKMFEMATREKFRFPFRGSVSVEDLWDLTPENLDVVFKALDSQRKKANEESLLATPTSEDTVLDTMIAIVKYIVNVKLEERRAIIEAKAKKEQKQKIMSILNAKQDEALQNKSIEELQAMLDNI